MIRFNFLRFNRRGLAFAHDALVAALSYALALYLRMGDDVFSLPLAQFLQADALFTLTCTIVFWFSGLYRGIWAFASVRDLNQIFRAASIAVVTFTIAAFLVMRLESVPRTAPFIAWFILMAGLGGSRLLLRILRERRLSALWERSGGGRVNILVIGAGDETDLFIRAVASNPQTPFRIVGIVGENAKRVGRNIHGYQVLGTVDDLPRLIEELRVQDRAPSRLVITRSTTRMNGEMAAKLLEQCATLGLKLSRLPDLTELRNDVSASPLADQPIALEDLLGRPETILDRDAIADLIAGRRVLITGAGGTIGSELVRQIAALGPTHITLLDICEFNLYRIDLEVREKFPTLSLRCFLADVRDMARLTQIFRDEKPEIVFHAAAIKHVPLAEFNAREALLTNMMGTRLVADCAAKTNVKAMVMISTDKAVHATSVMGATKRLAEMYIQALDILSPSSRFMTVRFGNVLGSTGSVVPRFQDQLAKGGPLTVTHPDITRYFMTVREAVELVLQASAMGIEPDDEQRGKVMVLDMGHPIKIADLARQMIRLAGKRPDEDVQIVYTGLRPGEKLYEELFSPVEEILPSKADGVHLAKSPTVELAQLQQTLANFATLLQAGMTETAAIARLEELVPDFKRG